MLPYHFKNNKIISANYNYSYRLKWNACHACVIGWAEYLYTAQQASERKPLKGPWNQAKRPSGCLKGKQPATPRLSSSACLALGLTSQAVPIGLEARTKCVRQHKEVLALLMQVSDIIEIKSSYCTVDGKCSVLYIM
jgi:hypothetical protein